MKIEKLLVGALVAGGMLTGCQSDEEVSGNARLAVRLTDAPGPYEAVNVDIREVMVHTAADADEKDGGWVSLNVMNDGVYNLLDFSNGVDTLLAEGTELPTGKVSQIRLVLGDNNSVVVDGETQPLKTPSAQQSGLKLKVNADLTPGITYEVLLDFDAARSVVKAGNSGKYNLKPVIRTIVEAQSGAIAGQVMTDGPLPAVFATNGVDTLGAIPQSDGMFLIRGAAPGTYEVTFNSPQATVVRTDVAVQLGEVSQLGTIEVQ